MKKPIKGGLSDLKKLSKTLEQHKVQAEKNRRQSQIAKEQEALKGLNHNFSLAEEDIALFRRSVRGVTPLVPHMRFEHSPGERNFDTPLLRAKRAQAEGNSSPTPPKTTRKKKTPRNLTYSIEEDQYLRSEHGRDILKKLKRLEWPVVATLDLHGATSDQAWLRFNKFIQSCLEFNSRCISIIYGKGHGSPQGISVLKDRVQSWLRNHDSVIAYVQAPENMGGKGALIILLKLSERTTV